MTSKKLRIPFATFYVGVLYQSHNKTLQVGTVPCASYASASTILRSILWLARTVVKLIATTH